MIAPTSKYGCGDNNCISCYGDHEWRAVNMMKAVRDMNEEAMIAVDAVQEEYESNDALRNELTEIINLLNIAMDYASDAINHLTTY